MNTLDRGVELHTHRALASIAPRLGIEPPEWTYSALCLQVDADLFYPEKGGSTREAKRICASCPVRAECLVFALENVERFGIWGGLSERERRRLAPLPAVQSAQKRPRAASDPKTCEDCGKACASGTGLSAHRRSAHGSGPHAEAS